MTTFLTRTTGTIAGRPPRTSGARPASAWAGLAMVAAVAVFAFPLAIWLRYARQVNGPGGLYAFVEAAAGHRLALRQLTQRADAEN